MYYYHIDKWCQMWDFLTIPCVPWFWTDAIIPTLRFAPTSTPASANRAGPAKTAPRLTSHSWRRQWLRKKWLQSMLKELTIKLLHLIATYTWVMFYQYSLLSFIIFWYNKMFKLLSELALVVKYVFQTFSTYIWKYIRWIFVWKKNYSTGASE